MIEKIRALIEKYKDFLTYILFGATTTVANYLSFIVCREWLQWSVTASETTAWAFSVIVAFLTNKPFVFHSHDWSAKTVWPEWFKFVGTRLGTGVLDVVLMFLATEFGHVNEYVAKIAISLLVVILNYVDSKLLVFRKKQ